MMGALSEGCSRPSSSSSTPRQRCHRPASPLRASGSDSVTTPEEGSAAGDARPPWLHVVGEAFSGSLGVGQIED